LQSYGHAGNTDKDLKTNLYSLKSEGDTLLTHLPWLIQRSRRSSGLFSGVVMARSREQDVTISVP
jgi:hypothetical protein